MELGEAIHLRYQYSHEERDLEAARSHLGQARSLDCYSEQDAVHIVTVLGDIVFLQLT